MFFRVFWGCFSVFLGVYGWLLLVVFIQKMVLSVFLMVHWFFTPPNSTWEAIRVISERWKRRSKGRVTSLQMRRCAAALQLGSVVLLFHVFGEVGGFQDVSIDPDIQKSIMTACFGWFLAAIMMFYLPLRPPNKLGQAKVII